MVVEFVELVGNSSELSINPQITCAFFFHSSPDVVKLTASGWGKVNLFCNFACEAVVQIRSLSPNGLRRTVSKSSNVFDDSVFIRLSETTM